MSPAVNASTPAGLESVALQSLIAQLEVIDSEQQWETTHAKFKRLNDALAPFSCCGIRNEFEQEIDGE